MTTFCVYDKGYCNPGQWPLNIKSVIVFGRMEIVNEQDKIVEITTKLCRKFTQNEEYIKSEVEKYAHKTLLLELTPEHICGKLVEES